jgi:hypothetical protein
MTASDRAEAALNAWIADASSENHQRLLSALDHLGRRQLHALAESFQVSAAATQPGGNHPAP